MKELLLLVGLILAGGIGYVFVSLIGSSVDDIRKHMPWIDKDR